MTELIDLLEQAATLHKALKPQKQDTVKTAKKKLTFYMDQEMYLRWKEYEFKQLQTGKKGLFSRGCRKIHGQNFKVIYENWI